VIKAIIFDFFGVLGLRDAASFRRAHLAHDPKKNQEAHRLNDELSLGKLGYDDFISELAKLGGVGRDKVLQFTEDYRPNEELLSYIRDQLKPHYKLGIVSNAGQDWVLRIMGEDNVKLFDDIILSYKVGVIKPEPEIYELSANNLGVKPQECIFVDDIYRLCQGAESTGMKTIWYKDFEGFETEIKKILS
jgi:HAD superfamily hydrolase (TIGR01509 family)